MKLDKFTWRYKYCKAVSSFIDAQGGCVRPLKLKFNLKISVNKVYEVKKF